MDARICAVIMIIIQVAATIIATSFVDNVGRKVLLIVSSFGACIGLTLMGTYTFLSEKSKPAEGGVSTLGHGWIPLASISVTVFMAYIGLLPLVFVIIMEVLPAKVKIV